MKHASYGGPYACAADELKRPKERGYAGIAISDDELKRIAGPRHSGEVT
jgi:hypothetical protein